MGRYILTGCAGFIGAKVAEFLLSDKHQVLGIDNLNNAYDVRLKRWRLGRLIGRRGFDFHEMDITNWDACWHLFENTGGSKSVTGADEWVAVINLAARAGVRQSIEDPWSYFDTNVTGSLNLLELCRRLNIKKFVLASTSSIYGADNPRPFREDAIADKPVSPYASSKKAAESLCYTYHYLYGLDITVLRYFTVYGPAGRPDMSLFRFVQWINESRSVTVYGDGKQERDFTYVDDIARGTIAALRPLGYEVINLGSDRPVVLVDAIKAIEDLVGVKSIIENTARHRADVEATWADINKARELLGWRPQVSFNKGIAALTTWYKENKEWARHIQTT